MWPFRKKIVVARLMVEVSPEQAWGNPSKEAVVKELRKLDGVVGVSALEHSDYIKVYLERGKENTFHIIQNLDFVYSDDYFYGVYVKYKNGDEFHMMDDRGWCAACSRIRIGRWGGQDAWYCASCSTPQQKNHLSHVINADLDDQEVIRNAAKLAKLQKSGR